MVAQREKLFRLLSANPEIQGIVARALEVEENDTISRYCYGEWPTYAVHRANRSTRSMVILSPAGPVADLLGG